MCEISCYESKKISIINSL